MAGVPTPPSTPTRRIAEDYVYTSIDEVIFVRTGIFMYMPTQLRLVENDASDLLTWRDASVDPCENFFQFACGHFNSLEVMQPSYTFWNQFRYTQERIDTITKDILSQPKTKDDPNPLNKAKDIYWACMNTGQVDNTEDIPWEFTSDWYAEGKSSGWVSKFSSQTTGSDNLYVQFLSKLIQTIWDSMPPSDLNGFPQEEDAEEATRVELRKVTTFMSNLKKITSAPDTKKKEKKVPRNEDRPVCGIMSIRTLQEYTNQAITEPCYKMDWLEYLQKLFAHSEVLLTLDDQIYVENLDKILNILKLVDSTEQRILDNFLGSRIASFIAPETTDNLWDTAKWFYQKLNYIQDDYPRWMHCNHVVNDYPNVGMGMSIAYKFNQSYFKAEKLNEANEMINDLKAAFEDILKESSWMDDSTKDYALEKARYMLKLVGYPEWISNKTKLNQFYEKVDGVLTLAENIADNGGLREAYRAYGHWMKRKAKEKAVKKTAFTSDKCSCGSGGTEARLPGLQHYTNEQLFFLGFATNWCNVRGPGQSKNDNHAPNNVRVLASLSNMIEFADAWSCPKGSSMNPEKKVLRFPFMYLLNLGSIKKSQGAESGERIPEMTSDDDHHAWLNKGEEDELELHGYKRSKVRTAATWTCIVFTAGLLRLLFHWFPRLQLYATHTTCPLSQATRVLIVENYQQNLKSYYVKDVIKQSNQHDLMSINFETTGKFHLYLKNGRKMEVESYNYFYCKKLCYVWDAQSRQFIKLSGLESALKNADFYKEEGLTEAEQIHRQITYGPNEIVIPVKSVFALLVLEVLTPFYIFQLFSLGVWFAEDYFYYAIAVIIMLIFGSGTSVLQTRRNQMQLRKTIHSAEIATVVRRTDGRGTQEVCQDVLASALVPGDIIALPPQGCILPCDAVLLSGNAIVNECMLTGESVPVTKIPIHRDDKEFNEWDDNTRHSILFCGTKVLQTRFHGKQWARAVVLRTGFLTTKGQIVQTILYPPPVDFRFERDAYRFLCILAMISTIGVIQTIVTKTIKGFGIKDIILKGLVLYTIVLPPALPAAMTVGKIYAQQRLKKKGIFCINSRIINISGTIDCVCFDKTGTLTEDGLDLWGVIPSKGKELQDPVTNFPIIHHSQDQGRGHVSDSESFVLAMATCHSLTYIDGEMAGDPLDQKMFESTGWHLDEPEMSDVSKFGIEVPMVVQQNHDDNPIEIGIARQFYFSSTLQRMSVITRALGSKNFNIYCKGSPEMLMSLSKPESIPSDITSVLASYTRKGFRVLALASRTLSATITSDEINKMEREEVETNLTFLGFILFENRLKKITASVINNLRTANIRQIMVTGDNILTAISVAQECGLVAHKQKVYRLEASASEISVLPHNDVGDHLKPPKKLSSASIPQMNWSSIGRVYLDDANSMELGIPEQPPTYALTGQTWATIRRYHPEALKIIVKDGTIFARMTPDQKQQLVQELQAIGHNVAMCGDGANDCGALKAAHAGVSLSDAESAAASAFTSSCGDVSCVPEVIAEGRCALVTSFGIFKFMAGYSLTQFTSVIILYIIDSYLTDFEFLYIDLCLVTLLAAIFGITKPPDSSKGLSSNIPSSNLFSIYPIASILFQIVLMAGFQVIGFYGVRWFPWYKPFTYGQQFTDFPSPYASYENYGVFSISIFQYIWMVIIFSRGAPHRRWIFSNRPLVSALVILTAFSVFLALFAPLPVRQFFELAAPPSFRDRVLVLPITIANLVLCYLVERVLFEHILEPGKLKCNRRQKSTIVTDHGLVSAKEHELKSYFLMDNITGRAKIVKK
ncbi:polyamine-transporting ATPase 13A3-like [Hetaerina americana]|uniref:polyamine-transporting ATPase 13A3-like n=1 Tax=Hetaerina americana TaxID=62018 RepID=UPI003A7F3521